MPKLSPVEECVDVPKVFYSKLKILNNCFLLSKCVGLEFFLIISHHCRRFAQRRRWTLGQSRSRSQRNGATSPPRSPVLLKHHFCKNLKAALKVHKIVVHQYYAEKICWHGFDFSQYFGCDFSLVLFHTVPNVPVSVLK